MNWTGRRVFLTGHTGFKGGWLALLLQQLGAEVCGYSMDSLSEPSLFRIANVAESMSSTIGDIRNVDLLRSTMLNFRPEIVFHLAAQPLVRYSYKEPLETFSVNVMGTANVLEVVRSCPSVRAVVCVTTDKCYENREWVWPYRETDALGGYDPYSGSKACSELVVSSYRNSFFNEKDYSEHGVAIATARAGNVIGGGDWSEDRLVPDIIRAFVREQPVRIRNPHSIRPWQHVMEPIRGYLTLAESLIEQGAGFGSSWNFGPLESDTKTVVEVVEAVAKMWGPGAYWTVDDGPHVHEAHYLKLDCSKAHSDLDWKPQLSLTEALQITINWYSAWRNRADLQAVTLAQLANYFQ